MTDPFDVRPAPSPATPAALIEQAGSRSAAARLVALGAAAATLGSQVWASLGVPGPAGYEFFFSPYEWTDSDIALLEPLQRISVDATTLVAGRPDAGDATPATGPARSVPRLSSDARALDADRRQSFEGELEDLWEVVSARFLSGAAVTADDAGRLRRFDELLRFVMPDELLGAYNRLNPAFFAWLDGAVGTGVLRHAAVPPVDAPGTAGRPPDDGPGGPESWYLPTAALLSGVAELGLTIEPGSALDNPVAGAAADALAPGPSPDWHSEQGRAVLGALCAPQWSIEQIWGDGNTQSSHCCYIGGADGAVIWVDDLLTGGLHLLSFPAGPDDLAAEIVDDLDDEGPDDDRWLSLGLSAAEVQDGLLRADRYNEEGESAFGHRVGPPSGPEGVATAGWATVATCLGLSPLPDTTDPADTADRADPSEPALLSPASQNLARNLGALRRFGRIRVRSHGPDGPTGSPGLLVALTDRRWVVFSPETGWPDDGLAPSTPVQVVSASAEQVGGLVAELLGGDAGALAGST